MTPIEEARVLAWLIKRIKVSPDRAETLASRVRVGLWLVLVVLFMFLFSSVRYGGLSTFVIGLALVVVGLIAGVLLAYASGLRQWNVIVPHVNQESVSRRLEVLKPNNSLERTR